MKNILILCLCFFLSGCACEMKEDETLNDQNQDTTDTMMDDAINSFNRFFDQGRIEEGEPSYYSTNFGGDYFSFSTKSTTNKQDVVFSLDAKPFITAGLDVSKLTANQYSYDAEKNLLNVYDSVGSVYEGTDYDSSISNMFGSNQQYFKNQNGVYSYNMPYSQFEWSKDLSKGFIYRIAAQDLIAAGVNPEKLESGWNYDKTSNYFYKNYYLE